MHQAQNKKKHIIKRHQTTCKLVGGGVSESRPTYKLKLIKTINYLMLFRSVELVLYTRQQANSSIKWLNSSLQFHSRSRHIAVSSALYHLIVFIHKSILMCYFAGRESEISGSLRIAKICELVFHSHPHQNRTICDCCCVCLDRNDVINSRNWLNAGTQVSCFMSSH